MKVWTKERRVVLGLSDKEGKLLENLHAHGPLNTSALAYNASLPRITAMRILKTLKEREFVTRSTKKREVVWSPIDTAVVKKNFSSLFADSLKGTNTIELSEVGSLVIYRGLDEMLTSNEKMLAAHAGERVLAIDPNGVWKHFASVSTEAWIRLNTLFKEKNILVEIVLEEGFEEHIDANGDTSIKESIFSLAVDIRVVKAGFLDSSTEVLIFRDQILFMDWAHLVAVEIKNPSTMRVMKAMYRLLQESGRPHQVSS